MTCTTAPGTTGPAPTWPASCRGWVDGTLAVSPFRIDRSDPDARLFDDNAGLIDNDPILFTSSDGGRTWSDPQVQELPGGMNLTAAQGLVELEDGRWLATFDQWPAFGDSGAYEPRMWSCTSADPGPHLERHDGHGGRRWGGQGILARAPPQVGGRPHLLAAVGGGHDPAGKGAGQPQEPLHHLGPGGEGLVKAGGDQPAGADQLHGAASPTAASPRSTPAARPAVPVSSWPCPMIPALPGTWRARCRCGTQAAGTTIGYDSAGKYPAQPRHHRLRGAFADRAGERGAAGDLVVHRGQPGARPLGEARCRLTFRKPSGSSRVLSPHYYQITRERGHGE